MNELNKLMEHREAYDQFLDFDTMMKVYSWTSGSPITSLVLSFRDIDNLTVNGLTELIFLLFNKYPNTRYVDVLRHGAKRGVQIRHYEKVFGRKPSDKLLATDERYTHLLDLQDMPYVEPPVEKLEEKPKEEEKPKPIKEKKQRECKEDKPKTEFSAKIKVMPLDEVIKWAREVGVPDDKIQHHSSKSLGLAKMNLANMIRARIDVSKI